MIRFYGLSLRYFYGYRVLLAEFGIEVKLYFVGRKADMRAGMGKKVIAGCKVQLQ